MTEEFDFGPLTNRVNSRGVIEPCDYECLINLDVEDIAKLSPCFALQYLSIFSKITMDDSVDILSVWISKLDNEQYALGYLSYVVCGLGFSQKKYEYLIDLISRKLTDPIALDNFKDAIAG